MRAFRNENLPSPPEAVVAAKPAPAVRSKGRARKVRVAPLPMIVAPRLVHELHNVMMEVSARAAICVALSTRTELRSHLVGIDAAVERGRSLVRLYARLIESASPAATRAAPGGTDPLAALSDAAAIITALSGRRVAIAATAQARRARVRAASARLRSRVMAMMTRAMDRFNADHQLHWSVSIEPGIRHGVLLELLVTETGTPRARHEVVGRLVLAPAASVASARPRDSLRTSASGRHAS